MAFENAVEDRFHVAMIEGRVAGTGTVDLKTGRIDAVFVHPDFMRRGIGADDGPRISGRWRVPRASTGSCSIRH